MGEKKILTEADIDAKLAAFARQAISYIDPMKMAQWSLERACAMVDNAVGKKKLERAIADGELEAFRVGKELTVEPQQFLLWYKRHIR